MSSWMEKGNSPIYKYCFTEQWSYKLSFVFDPGIIDIMDNFYWELHMTSYFFGLFNSE